MAGDHTDGTVGSQGTLELSRSLARLLRRHGARVEALRKAESNYHDVVLIESLRHKGKMKRASEKRIAAAFDGLVDAVVALQGSRVAVVSLAEDEGIPLEAAGACDETFESADRECAGYLAARSYDQVREAAERDPLPDRRS